MNYAPTFFTYFLLSICCLFSGALAQDGAPKKEAALALPSSQQIAWHELEVGMFIHFGPNTWQDKEYDDLSTPLDQIKPELLDTEQWASVAQSMGAKYVVFVAKHVGGFCWWQTDTTDYSVRKLSWRGGKGDVLRDLAESCKKRNIKLGVYLSPADATHGAGLGGKCLDESKQQKYINIYRTQLTEVLSRYGDMCEVWFDGSLVFDVMDIVEKLAPNAVVFQGPKPTIRWVGNEDGFAPDPAWPTVNSTKTPVKEGVFTAGDGDPNGDLWLPNECDARMRAEWFWNTKNEPTLKTVAHLMEMYEKSVGRGGNLLLNATPDKTGLIPAPDVARAAEFGAEVRRRYGKRIAEKSGNGNMIQIDLGSPAYVDAVAISEDITKGARVREYAVEAETESGWKLLSKGTSIGRKKIDTFNAAATARIRVRIINSVGEPQIKNFSLYRTSVVTDQQIIEEIRVPAVHIYSPLDYQVFQRNQLNSGVVRVSGRVPPQCTAVLVRLFNFEGTSLASEQMLAPVLGTFATMITVPAGGWYRAEIIVKSGDNIIAQESVAHFGVGEVFVGAGQSNSTNSGGDGKLDTTTKMVSAFSGSKWQIANDPQPGVHDQSNGGSFWPAFGDAMFDKYRVPIGIAVTGHGGTSIRQWQRNGELYQWFTNRLLQFGPHGVRAVLWHQGESDVSMTAEQYATGLAQIIKDCRETAGWEVPWFVARVSYHSPAKPSHESTRAAHKLLWDSGLAFEGPDTDILGGDNRDAGGKGIHFSIKGLTAHGKMWAEKVSIVLEGILKK
ncbi:MAG: alpha-L-fucosidase [Planctomycetota bacterium]